MKNNYHNSIMLRAARLLLAVVIALGLPAKSLAREFITNLMLIGGDTWSTVSAKLNEYKGYGWKLVDYDLNKGCGKKSDYVYLLYYTENWNDGENHNYITKIILDTSTQYPDVQLGGYYRLVPYEGSSHFVDMKGDLNSNAGGSYIHMYYTRETDNFGNKALTDIYFDSNSDGAVSSGGVPLDLNKGAGGAYIYMHYNTANYAFIDEGNTYDLSSYNSPSERLFLANNDVAVGELANPTIISVRDGATVTLRDVKINANGSNPRYIFSCSGDAEIILEGDNVIRGCSQDRAAIGVYPGKTLIITGDGSLKAYCGTNESGESRAAAIGGWYNYGCGNVYIVGGNIEAVGGKGCAAIGGTENQHCGQIYFGAGITKVVAVVGEDAPNAIGGGKNGTCDGAYCDESLIVMYNGNTWIIAPPDPDGIKTLSDSPLKDENIYNLAGQRLNKMQKGINIVNGRKVLK